MINWLPSLNSLRALEAVARHLSFQKAAEELHVTSAAVQQLVRKLEDTLDVSLVVKDGRQLRLTDRAEIAIADLEDGFSSIKRAVNKIRQYNDRPQIKISVEPAFATSWLVERLTKFQAKYNEIDVLIDSTIRIVNLERGEADIAIRYTAGASEGNIHRRLFDDETIVVCSPSLLKNEKRPYQTDILSHLPIIHYNWPHGVQMKIDWHEWVERMGIKIKIDEKGLHLTDYNMLIQSAIAGLGLALISRPLAADALSSNLVIEPFSFGLKNGFNYDLVVAENMVEKPEIKAFIDWIMAEI